MRKSFAYGIGGILSADIAVPEHERELAFYSSVLATGEPPLWRADLMNNRGTPIIGLGARSADYEMLPLQWMPHIQVADVGVSAQRALDRGGSELLHSRDEAGKSQWAVLVDPDGAAFGIIPVVEPESGSTGDDAPSGGSAEAIGCIGWLSLAVPDAATAHEFYRDVVGWETREVEIEDGDERCTNFEMQRADGSSAAEVCQARGAARDLPPVWLVHLPVADLAESLRRVRAAGGQVISETGGSGGSMARAVIRDPVGAWLALLPG